MGKQLDKSPQNIVTLPAVSTEPEKTEGLTDIWIWLWCQAPQYLGWQIISNIKPDFYTLGYIKHTDVK